MELLYTISAIVILWTFYMGGYYRAKHKYQPDEQRRAMRFGKLRKQVQQKLEQEGMDEEEFLREIYKN